MKTFLEFTDDKAAIEAELKQRELWQQWQAERLKCKMQNWRFWSYFEYSASDESVHYFCGMIYADQAEDVWFYLHSPHPIDLSILLYFLQRIYTADRIVETLQEFNLKSTIPFREN